MDILSFSYKICLISEKKMLSKYCLLFALVLTFSLVDAQDDNPPGFVSIDCGLAEGSDYKSSFGIYYTSDANFTDSGESRSISSSLPKIPIWKHLTTVRSFPQGKKNCYTIKTLLGKGKKYLIRATFMYGNYDSLNRLPTFDLNLGADTWSNIKIEKIETVVQKEIIHVLSSDYVHVCLIKTGTTTPFISALELRPLNSTNSMYTTDSGSLQTIYHVNCDSETTDFFRYAEDIYDRIWVPFNYSNTVLVSTLLGIDNGNEYLVPVDVMKTASTPDNISDPFQFSWEVADPSVQFYMYMHFAEVEKLEANQSREFNIYINGELWNLGSPVVPKYLIVDSYAHLSPITGKTKYTFSINKAENSALPPIINAYELYTVQKFSNSGTDETDVAAILNIKSTYGVIRDSWQGDPCEPEDFLWDGLKCSYDSSDSARIISLNLSMRGLTGEIVPSLANLTQLTTLDLSNNNLSGQVPAFLSQLPLKILNLKGNNFTGPLPAQLLEMKRKEILSLSFDGPGNGTNIEKKSNKSILVPGVILSVILFVFFIWIMIILRARRLGNETQVNNGDRELERQFTNFEVEAVNITRNFRRELGEGGFRTVYNGCVGDIQVDVKMLMPSPTSTQGYREFQPEVSLQMSISHKGLTSLVGYCNEGTNMGIIYEYMANQSLYKHLSGQSGGILSWKIRLHLALDAAIVSFFYCSYCKSNRLTEKSDVFNFGVVLLEMITGPPAIIGTQDRTRIVQWVDSIVKNGDVKQVVDPKLEGKFNVNSARKVVELALTCASPISSRRPTMNMVVLELIECLAVERGSHDADRNNLIGIN